MYALTLQAGPISWHYQSVSGIININEQTGSDKPHFGDSLSMRRVAGRNRG
jgi:hypothetical protein